MRTSEWMSKAYATEAYMDLEEEYQRDEQYGGVEVVVVQQPTKEGEEESINRHVSMQ
jgi:hypothetical protein